MLPPVTTTPRGPLSDDLPLPDFDDADVAPQAPASAVSDFEAGPAYDTQTPNAYDAAAEAIARRNQRMLGDGGLLAAAPPPPSEIDRGARIEVESEHPGFDARFSAAWSLALRPAALPWSIALFSLALGASFVFADMGRLTLFALPVWLLLAGAHGVHFGQAALAGAHDEGGPLHVDWSWPDREDLSMLSLVLGGAAAGWILPAMHALQPHQTMSTRVLGLAAGAFFVCYWPIALTGVAASGRLTTLLRFFALSRAALALGRRYWQLVAIDGVVLFLCALMTHLAGLQLMGGLSFAIAMPFLSSANGYLMGCMTAERPEPFRMLRR